MHWRNLCDQFDPLFCFSNGQSSGFFKSQSSILEKVLSLGKFDSWESADLEIYLKIHVISTCILPGARV